MTDFGLDLVFATVLYVALLLVIGVGARRVRIERSVDDFYLAGRSFGFLVLFLTLFATQYSGNSFSGFPGQVYREGLAYVMSVPITIAIVVGYLLFAPRLFALSRRFGFLTPTDYLNMRFRSRALSTLASVIFVWTLGNFLVAQLMALGQVFSGFTGGAVPYRLVVVTGAVVVLGYQLLGGMRAAAWTDVLQGALILVGLVLIAGLIWREVGSPPQVVRTIQLLRPDLITTPDLETSLIWISNLLLIGLGTPLYPQAIQRVYAARRLRDLRRTLAVSAVIPIGTVTVVIFIGAAGIALFPHLDRLAADQVTFRVVSYLVESSAFAYYPALLVALAVAAAIMSTADSCLLSLTSILTEDVLRARRPLEVRRAEWPRGMIATVMVLSAAVAALVAMRPLTTLWGLLIVKFEVLVQLSPAFVLGTLHDRGDGDAFAVSEILAGIAAGLSVTLVLYLSGYRSLYGLNAGTVGVAVNYTVVFLIRMRRLARTTLTIT